MAKYTERISLTLDLIFELCGEYRIKEEFFCGLFTATFPLKEYIKPHLDRWFKTSEDGRFVEIVDFENERWFVVTDRKDFKFDQMKEVPNKIYNKFRLQFVQTK